MNARQKAKKYKKELDFIKNRVFKPTYVTKQECGVKEFASRLTFVGTRVYCNEVPEDVITRKVIEDLLDNPDLQRYIKVTKHVDLNVGKSFIEAKIKVVEPWQ